MRKKFYIVLFTLLSLVSNLAQTSYAHTILSQSSYQPQAENLSAKITKCENANQLRAGIVETLSNIKDVISNFDEIKRIGSELKTQLSDYYNLVTDTTNAGRYEAGRLVVPALSTVISLTKISKVGKTKSLLKAGKELTEKEADELVEKLLKKGESTGLIKRTDDILFGSARQFVREKYGQDILNQLAAKFGAINNGAAAVILQKWGDEGLAILNKMTVNTLDDVAKELVMNKTMYRYVDETSYNFTKLKTQGLIDASPSQFPGYATLDRIDDATRAQSILQLPKKPTWVAEFSSSQILNDVRFPMAKFNNADYIEVLTRSYPEWGVGGGSQFITNSQIKISKLRNLETGEFINFNH